MSLAGALEMLSVTTVPEVLGRQDIAAAQLGRAHSAEPGRTWPR
jgi:hypothetical protein